ncbi:MAG: dipeptide epimerase [Fimbriimonadaceae bacterium]|nr:dipeptide epimerase [Fimbriimonadaceae bacterium]
MRITDVAVYKWDIPLSEPFRIATMVTDVAPNILVRVTTDEGLVGWGEGSPLHSIVGETQGICLAAAKDLRAFVLGRDPLEIAALSAEMARFLPHNTTTACAFDMAFHDVAAKRAGLPLWRNLGGTRRPLPIDVTISIVSAKEARRAATEIFDAGYDIIKMKLGGEPADDLERVEAVREEVGPGATIRVDANQGWDRIAAVEALQALEEFDVEFCEQPLRAHDLAGLQWVAKQTTIPIMADESLFGPESALELVLHDVVPMFNIKLSKSRGIHYGRQIAAIAEAGGIRCMVGAMVESKLGLTAIAHFATTSPAMRYFDLDTTYGQKEDPVLGGVTVAEGCVHLPDGLGIGAEPDPGWLSRCERVA